jgi:uncharacterized protein YybS (DUF2232 family)
MVIIFFFIVGSMETLPSYEKNSLMRSCDLLLLEVTDRV